MQSLMSRLRATGGQATVNLPGVGNVNRRAFRAAARAAGVGAATRGG